MIVSSLAIVVACLALAGCDWESTSKPFSRHVRGDFDPQNVEAVERLVQDFSDNNAFKLIAKDRSGMSFITQGLPAFFIFLYLPNDGDPFMTIGNVGAGTVIDVTLIETQSQNLIETEPKFEALVSSLIVTGLVRKLEEVPKGVRKT